MTEYCASGLKRPESRAARTISGPTPAWSPRVMPMRQRIAHCHHPPAKSQRELEGPDVGLLAQTGQPDLLLPLGLFLDQFLLDFRPQFGERGSVATAFLFHLEDVIVRPELDHM